jgi:hypothetical protein
MFIRQLSVNNLRNLFKLGRNLNFMVAGYELKLLNKICSFTPRVLYGRETSSLTLREEHRLRVYENRMLRIIFGPKMKWRKGGEECFIKYYQGDQEDEIGGACSMQEMRNAYKMLVKKPEGKRLLRRHRHRCQDNIRIYLREARWQCVD